MDFGLLTDILYAPCAYLLVKPNTWCNESYKVKIYSKSLSNGALDIYMVGVFDNHVLTLPSCPSNGVRVTNENFNKVYKNISGDLHTSWANGFDALPIKKD